MSDRVFGEDRLYSLRRVGVCGSSKGLPAAAASLCRAIGTRLAQEPTVKIVSGGTKRRKSALGADNFAAEWLVVSSARESIPEGQIDERIITVVKDEDGSASTRFAIGSTQRAKGKTSEARRISFVRNLDALVAIGGGDGTRQELALALEFGTTVLPVPGFSGAAAEVWKWYRSEIVDQLRIAESRARQWEEATSASVGNYGPLADDMIQALMASLPKKCFVIMPFSEDFTELYDCVIHRQVIGLGDVPIRVDRIGITGNVTAQIENGLRTCDYAIAVLDGLRPNVLYELGLAHAHRKPVILLNRRGALGAHEIPFDIHSQQRLEYSSLDDELRARLSEITRVARLTSR
jgi:hypothetical protein